MTALARLLRVLRAALAANERGWLGAPTVPVVCGFEEWEAGA